MPIPSAVRAILGNVWASAAGALKQDPSAADPAIVRADGYPASFSSTLVPEQETIQGRWNEFDSAIDDIYTSGVPFYDALIDYPIECITNEAGVLYTALVANGPGTSNAIAPSADTAGTTWSRVSGTQGAPSAPSQPTATSPASRTLDVQWNCPLDGGSVITEFNFQYRNAGQTWAQAQDVDTTVPFTQLTGLTNGTAIEFRVRAVNAIDTGAWSPTGTGTPTAAQPGGGSTLALTARGGDTEATLTWLEPDDGGSSITGYHVQWKSGSQAFSSSRQATVTTTTYTRTGLTNGTEYDFRVRAVNSVGNSTWSNEASATPAVGEHVVTAAGLTTFTWPWSATVARVLAYGGGGGGGSYAHWNHGTDGGSSSVTHGADSVDASGGRAGLQGNHYETITSLNLGTWLSTAYGNGGDGGRQSGFADSGYAGAPGELVIETITGLSVGDTLSVTVGAGGAGGAGGGANPISGTPGTAGSVTIVPVY